MNSNEKGRIMGKRSLAAAVAAGTTLLVPALAATPAHAASSFYLMNEKTWDCIEITNTAKNAVPNLKKCKTSDSFFRQHATFQVKWYNHLVNPKTGRCLDINVGKNKKVNSGDSIVTNACNKNAANQKWELTGDDGMTIEHMNAPHLAIAESGHKVILQSPGYPVPENQVWLKHG
jgi:Ricin-type beta-trefoil lectin domain